MIDSQDITGLVLAGGRGSRMGGVDKGLQAFRGVPLALHTLLRLQRQVGAVVVNANRNLVTYESFGFPVWPDADSDYAGPLSGFLTGLERCETPWLVTVPCDSPLCPQDLVRRRADAADQADVHVLSPAISLIKSPIDRDHNTPSCAPAQNRRGFAELALCPPSPDKAGNE